MLFIYEIKQRFYILNDCIKLFQHFYVIPVHDWRRLPL